MRFGWLERVALASVSVLHVALCRTVWRRPAVGGSTSPARALLVIRCEAKLGDSLLHVPFLRALRQAFPDRAIHLVHHRAAAAVYAACPYVDRRIEFDWEPSSVRSVLTRLGAIRQVFATLADRTPYAIAICSRWDQDLYAPFFAWFSGAPRRVGFSRHVTPQKALNCLGTDLLYTDVADDATPCHEAARPLALLRLLGRQADGPVRLEYGFGREDAAQAAALMTQRGHAPWIAIAPGAAIGRRQWAAERFTAVGAALAARFGVQVVLLGAGNEQALCDAMWQRLKPNALNLAGQIPLPRCAAVLARCRLFIGNDSGLAHLACAVGLPVVEVSCQPEGASRSGPNAPERFGPTVAGSIVVRPERPASHACADGCLHQDAHCIQGVGVEAVLQAAADLLARLSTSPAGRAEDMGLAQGWAQ